MSDSRATSGASWRSSMEARNTPPAKFIYNLPYSVVSDISVLLDVNGKWKALGGTHLGFTIQDLLRIEQRARLSDDCSYTMIMLMEWGQQNHTVTELFLYLAKMKLYQAMSLLKGHVSPRFHHLLHEGTMDGNGSLHMNIGPMSEPMESGASGWNHVPFSGLSSLHNDNNYLPKPPLPGASQYPEFEKQARPVPVQDTAYDFGPHSDAAGPCTQRQLLSSQAGASPGGYSYNRPRSPYHENQLCENYDKMYVDPRNLNTRPEKPSLTNTKASPKMSMLAPEKAPGSSWGPPSAMGAGMFSASGIRLPNPPLPLPMESIEDNTQVPFSRDESTTPTHARLGGNGVDGTFDRQGLPSTGSRRRSENNVPTAIGRVPYSDIVDATNNFSNRVLGRGGFGIVYEGCWKKLKVAIKHIVKKDNPGLTSLEEAKLRQSYAELKTLNECRYDNILPLYGYAVHETGLCLMYQFMVNGSLEDRLLKRGGTASLTWKQRFLIARGSARGIQYLHNRSPRIIHGDIKSANILLDVNFEPKIGDFGLAREGPSSQCTHTMVSAVHGTQPYLPVDFMRSRKLSSKVDTYSFGVVLFELATGLRAYDEDRPKKKNLRDYVTEYDSALYGDLRDQGAGEEDGDTFVVLIEEGKRCTSSMNKDRPEMSCVFEDLDAKLQALDGPSASNNNSSSSSIVAANGSTVGSAPVPPGVHRRSPPEQYTRVSTDVKASNVDVTCADDQAPTEPHEGGSATDASSACDGDTGNGESSGAINVPYLTELGTKLPSS